MDDFIKITFFILMLIVSYTLAKYIVVHKHFQFLHTRKNRYGAIDGLRGYLALSIFAHHFMLTWYWKNTTHWWRPQEVYFQNIGLIGVMLFFMITGYLFTTKILQHSFKINWMKLYKSRIFRIYPLYLFAVILISIIIFTQPEYQHNIHLTELLKQYGMWFIYQGGNLHTHTHTPLIIAGVDWTLKYEWIFYLSLPFIAFLIMLNRWVALLFSILGILYFFENKHFFTFETQHLIFFIIGGLTASIYYYLNHQFITRYIDNIFISITITIALIYTIFYKEIYTTLPIVLISIFFIAIAGGNSFFGLMHKKASLLLGEVSYSIYLLHGVSIYILFTLFETVDLHNISSTQHTYMLPLIVILVIIFSVFTYLFIEKPAIDFAKKEK